MKVLMWVILSTIALMAYTMTVGLYPRYFDIEWDEEVQLHDGRVIVVHLKHRYERLGKHFLPYARVIQRDTEIGFQVDGGIHKNQLFKGFSPMFLGQYEGVWYMVLHGGYYGDSRNVPGQDWGDLEGPYDQWAVKFEKNQWLPISMSRLPDIFQKPNMLILYGKVEEHLDFDGKTVSLKDKVAWLEKHPWAYSDVQLTRPTATSPRRKDSVNKFQE